MKTKETYFVNFTENEKKLRFILSKGEYDSTIQDFYSHLSSEEKQIVENFKASSRKNEFIAGRILAKENIRLLQKELTETGINIETGVWGFPLIQTKGISNMQISIAHTKHHAAAFLAEDNTYPIGVDVEEILAENEESLDFYLSRYNKDFSLQEKYIYWASKEAVSKALRTGFTIPEGVFEVKEIKAIGTFYEVSFKHLTRLKAIAWIQQNTVISMAFPTELKFDSIKSVTF
ncbi:4'-phosphopantetheinyl transferase superfamily protein [Pseudotenacibaculum sp. MALMAid0570]|uniref:4'-phosphopantetheinyl transferase family protein n=1 Tax=Pseudotenacibaculum sp. MALMAid0570 TaxID=3143938 RepID=UPI0032DEE57F